MNRNSKYLNDHGYTLIEIIIVIVILGIIGAFTFQMVAAGVQAFKKSGARKHLFDQGRLALERMVRELRDAKEVTGSFSSSITFKKAHPAQAADNIEEIRYELVGNELKRVGDPAGTPLTAVLAVNVSSFAVTGVAGGEGGAGTCSINFDGANSASGSGTQLIFSHTIGGGSNRLLVVSVSIENGSTGPTVSSITYGGQNLTKIGSVQTGTGTIGRSELWYALETDLPSAGANNVVVNVSASVSYLLAGAISLDGVAQQAPEAQNTNAVTGTSNISTSITTVTNGAWIVDSVHSGEGGSYTANSGQTERYDRNSGTSTHAASTLSMATAGSTFVSWTHSFAFANRQTHVVAAFAPAADCAGSTVAGNLVMVTGDGAYSSGVDDAAKKTLFESWGWTVTAIDDGADQTTFNNAAANNDVMYISESCNSGTVGTKARDLDIGIVVGEDYLWNEMEFGSVGDGGQWGDSITISDNTHYITNPFATGNLVIYTTADDVGSLPSSLASGGQLLADEDVASEPSLFVFDTGATLDSGTAVNRRVGFPDAASDPAIWTGDFKNLLLRSLDWAAGAEAGNVATLELTLSSSEGGTVTMRTKVYMRNMQ